MLIPLLLTLQAQVPLQENLGRLHHPITTTVPLAQRYFDQGLLLTYGFNHSIATISSEIRRTAGRCSGSRVRSAPRGNSRKPIA